jgi:hypothetical protein
MRNGDPLEVCDGNGVLARAQLRGITASNRAYVETTDSIEVVRMHAHLISARIHTNVEVSHYDEWHPFVRIPAFFSLVPLATLFWQRRVHPVPLGTLEEEPQRSFTYVKPLLFRGIFIKDVRKST